MLSDDNPLTPAQARQKLREGLADYLAGKGSETIVFRLKRTKKAGHAYPLKLTQQQRETLNGMGSRWPCGAGRACHNNEARHWTLKGADRS